MADFALTGGPNVCGTDGVVRAANQSELDAGNVSLLHAAARTKREAEANACATQSLAQH